MSVIGIFYLIVITVGSTAQSIFKKSYNNKSNGKGAFTFNAFSVLCALLFFVVRSGFVFEFDPGILPYTSIFTLCYCAATIFNYFAIQCGPLSLTSLAASYSLIIPTVYGLVFDADKASLFLYIGLLLLVVSLFFINSSGEKSEVKITFKWLVFALVALVANGVCSTVQPVQQKVFNQKYQNEFMIISLIGVVIFLFILAFIYERGNIKLALKKGAPLMVLCGLSNGIVNLLVMVASASINKSVMFPLISAGGIVLTWLVSVFLYKEKLSFKQNIGLVFGIISIIFLNI